MELPVRQRGLRWTFLFCLSGSSQSVSGASNSSPITINSSNHGLTTGNFVIVSNVTGNTAANGFFRVTRIDANNFSLDTSIGNGSYTGGTWNRVTGPNPNPKEFDKTGAQGRIHFSILVDPPMRTWFTWEATDRSNQTQLAITLLEERFSVAMQASLGIQTLYLLRNGIISRTTLLDLIQAEGQQTVLLHMPTLEKCRLMQTATFSRQMMEESIVEQTLKAMRATGFNGRKPGCL